jgi:L-alanine-DL-glutamate epimerase-like enolase superfamily enzyme
MGMQLKFWRSELNLTHQWTIARGSASKFRVVFVELRDQNGVVGYGETAPSRRYQETIETVEAFFSHIDPEKLSFSDLKSLLNTTDGNVSVHARKLEDAGYVTMKKSFSGRTPLTEYKITPSGRKALEQYLNHMEALIKAMKGV